MKKCQNLSCMSALNYPTQWWKKNYATPNKENQTYTIGEAATLSKDSYVMFGTVLAQLAEFCMEQSEK